MAGETAQPDDRTHTEVNAEATVAAAFALPARWEVVRPLGSGGQAEVWLARDQELREWVAVKVFRDNLSEVQRERLRREVRFGRSLQHPGLVRTFELVDAGSRLAVVMEYVPEGSAAQRVAAGKLGIDEVAALAEQVLDVLAYLHAQGVVHRDVKPSNLLFDAEGRVRLADLGLARSLDEAHDLTQTALTVGTPGYMSPEQLRGQDLGPGSDLYALGITMYELLTGEHAFPGNSGFEIAERQLNAPVPNPRSARRDCPRWLSLYVQRLLQKEARDRFTDAATALVALRRRRWVVAPRRWRLAAGAAVGVAVAAAAALVGAGWWEGRREIKALVVGQEVVASDGAGRELWRKRFAADEVNAVAGRFLGPAPGEVAVGLRGISTRGSVPTSTPDILLLGPEGREIARFASVVRGFALHYPEFSEGTRGPAIAAFDLDHDGKQELVWRANHPVWYPNMLGYWNPARAAQPEQIFTNSGSIQGVWAADLDADGEDELVVAGLNNPLGWQSFVAVIKVRWYGGFVASGVSPDLVTAWWSSEEREPVVLSYTVVGSGRDVAAAFARTEGGFEVVLHGRRQMFDAAGNPAGSSHFGRGGEARRRFWGDLSRTCREIEAGQVDRHGLGAGSLIARFDGFGEEPMRRVAVLLLARSLARAGEHDLAVAMLRGGLQRSPGDRDLLLRLGEQLAIGGKTAEALAAWAQAVLRKDDGRAPLDAVIASIELAALANRPGAAEAAASVMRGESVDRDYLRLAAEFGCVTAFFRGSWSDASLDPRPPTGTLPVIEPLRAWAALGRGGSAGDAAAAAAALEANPETRDVARLLHATAEIRLGRAAEARGMAEQALESLTRKARTEVEAFVFLGLAERVLGDALLACGDRAGAREHLANAAARAPRTWFGRVPRV